MMRFYADRAVIKASGTQTFAVNAVNAAEAKKKFIADLGVIDTGELDIDELGPWEWDTLYTND